MLKNIIDLLEPFAAFTQLVSADKNATFSSAFLCIEELKLHLEKCSGITGLNGVATAMLEDLKRRFNFMSDERDPDFDGSYLLATCLDCNHRIHVIEDLNIQSLVVKHVVNIAKQMGLPYSATPTPGTEPPIIPTSSDSTQALEQEKEDTGYNNLNTSSFRLLMKKRATRLSNEFSSRSSSAMSGSSTSTQLDPDIQRPNIEKELLDYLLFANHEFDLSKDPPVQDVISYWKDLSGRFPYLSKLAFNLLNPSGEYFIVDLQTTKGLHVATVPDFGVIGGNKCWYPKTFGDVAAVKRKTPKEDWLLYQGLVRKTFDSYEASRAKENIATLQSDINSTSETEQNMNKDIEIRCQQNDSCKILVHDSSSDDSSVGMYGRTQPELPSISAGLA
ncbi:Uncharacterized protein APZ42_030131 [Daphnia magna]|uniref:Uncharacterized protein n=1 Tax=Daphnia magna TaxID=35525 RepID=A0A164P181_9CRUS|nr:Uncharacterized protein APZ42_030131 [Daphnia magna]